MGDAKIKNDSLFNEGILPPSKDVDRTCIDYETIEEVPVIEVEGGLEIDKDNFEDVRRVWLGYEDGKPSVKYYEPGEGERAIQESLDKLKQEGKDPENSPGPHHMSGFPADQKGNLLIQMLQQKTCRYTAREKDEEASLYREKDVRKKQHHKLGRAEKPDKNGKFKIYFYKESPKLDVPCQTMGFVPLTEVRGRADIIRLIKAGELVPGTDYCIGGIEKNPRLLFNPTRVEGYVDPIVIPNILKSGLFSNEMEKRVKADIERATNTERESILRQKESADLQKHQVESQPWLMSINTFVASLIGVGPMLWISRRQMQMMREQLGLQKEQMGIIREQMEGGKKEPILPKLRDITQEAREGKIKPVSPRLWPAIKQLAINLSKGKLANPTLLAENGVGKSAAVEGLALAIVNGILPDGTPLPDHLKGKRILEVSAGEQFSATKGGEYRGVMEAKFRQFLEEVKAAKDVIPFIDEVHELAKAGQTEGSAGIAQMFKAGTARTNEFQFIGATTNEEFARHFAGDKALQSRMPPVEVATPDAKGAIADLRFTREANEAHYGRKIPDATIDEIVRLSEPATYTNFPRKAFDLLETVAKQMDIEGDTSGTIIPERVRAYVEWKSLDAVANATSEAWREANRPKLSLQEIRVIQERSIGETLQVLVRDAEKLSDLVLEKIVTTLTNSWEALKPEARAGLTPPGTADFAIPQRFVEVSLSGIKDHLGIQLIPQPVVPAPPIISGGGGTGGPAPTGGTSGTGGTPPTGGGAPTGTPSPANPTSSPAPASGATASATARVMETTTTSPEAQALRALEKSTTALEVILGSKVMPHIDVRVPVGLAATTGTAAAFHIADYFGVPSYLTGSAALGALAWTVRSNPVAGVCTAVVHAGYFMAGAYPATAGLADLRGEEKPSLTTHLVGDLAGGVSWTIINKANGGGGPEKMLIAQAEQAVIGLRMYGKEIAAGASATATTMAAYARNAGSVMAAGARALASEAVATEGLMTAGATVGGIIAFAPFLMGMAGEEDVALMLAGDIKHRDSELKKLIRWALNSDQLDIDWYGAELDRNGLKGTKHDDSQIMKNNRLFMKHFTALARAKENGDEEATNKARENFVKTFPELARK